MTRAGGSGGSLRFAQGQPVRAARQAVSTSP